MNRLERFDFDAKRFAPWCQCGQYEPVRVEHGFGLVTLFYGPPGTRPIIPEQRWCRHRSIKLALIRAYRAGRAEDAQRGIE